MKKQTIFVTLIFAFSTLVQVISNIVLTRLFGTSIEYGLFLAAVTIPTIIVSVIYGTLNDALMPVFGELLATSKAKAITFFNGQLFSLTSLGFLITVILSVFSKPIMTLFFPNHSLEVETLSQLFSLLIWAVPFSIFVTILGMRQYTEKHFLRFPVAQLFGSLVNLILVLALYQKFGHWGLVYSFVINIIAQIFFVLPRDLKISFDNLLPTFSLWLPLVVGTIALKSDALIIRAFSAQMGAEYLVYQNLISKVCSLSAGLITIGLQVVLLPNIIETLGKKDFSKVKKLVYKAKLSAISLSLLLVLSIYLLAPYFIKILFVGNNFTLLDYEKTIELLPFYLIPIIGWGIVNVFVQPLYAIKKHFLVGVVALIFFVIAWFSATLLSSISIPLAISVSLSILLIGTSLGAEVIWQYYFRKLITC